MALLLDKLTQEYFARGGIIHRLPTAFSAPVAGASPTAENRSLIRTHELALEDRRRARFQVRSSLG